MDAILAEDPRQAAKKRQVKALNDPKLKALKGADKPYKEVDGEGLYVLVSQTGHKSFRYDYRVKVDGQTKYQTLVIGQYEPDTPSCDTDEQIMALQYGSIVSLKDARRLLDRAKREVKAGQNPSKAKVEQRIAVAKADDEAATFGAWVEKYFEHKADPKSGEEQLAESTLEMRKSNFARLLKGPIGQRKLDEIKTEELVELFDKLKAERGPGPAVHARELVLLVYRYAKSKGVKIENPVEAIERKSIATFKVRDRNLDRHEIKAFFEGLNETATAPSLRLAVRFMLLTMVRKGEFIGATWPEINWERATWTIPKERMKADKEHVVYLSDQAVDILETFKALYPSSKYLHPSRYESSEPISNATLNRTIDAAVKKINDRRPEGTLEFETFCVHDLRRTASSRLHDALFPEPLIEACLAHVKKDKVAAAYNHAKMAGPRRALTQGWADMIDCWMRGESAKEVIRAAKVKIDQAAHDDSEMDL